jgi:hypothetical protein
MDHVGVLICSAPPIVFLCEGLIDRRSLRNGDAMKLHHAAVIALVGWYLTIPPKPGLYLMPGVFFFNRQFDSRKDCEKAAAKYNQKIVDADQRATCVKE